MIELNQRYSTKALAEVLGISYGAFRNKKQEYLAKFYIYTKIFKGNTVYYTFEKEMYPFVPYKAMQKSSIIQSELLNKIIDKRIIVVDEEIQVLGLKLSTLTVYVRDIG